MKLATCILFTALLPIMALAAEPKCSLVLRDKDGNRQEIKIPKVVISVPNFPLTFERRDSEVNLSATRSTAANSMSASIEYANGESLSADLVIYPNGHTGLLSKNIWEIKDGKATGRSDIVIFSCENIPYTK